jgi:hypothetical protein
VTFKAPWFSKEDLISRAADYLRQYNASGEIPVDIDFIIEANFDIDIVPTPGLQRGFDVVAFISKDQQEIRVDEYVYTHRETRYRFSLAHELAHKLLHPQLWQELEFHNVKTWLAVVADTIPEKEYSFIEFHANFFAGCILVPSPQLRIEFEKCVEKARTHGITELSDAALEYIEMSLGRTFNVSREVIHRRLDYEEMI